MRLAAVLVFAAGCAASQPHARVALQLQGAAAGPAERQRCVDAATRAGAIIDAKAPVQAVVTLEPTGSRLQVMSMRRGLVRDESKPAGSVEALCQDAALVGATTADTSPSVDWSATTPGPDQPARAPSTSGGDYRGPIN
jgi:hypothetical protein